MLRGLPLRLARRDDATTNAFVVTQTSDARTLDGRVPTPAPVSGASSVNGHSGHNGHNGHQYRNGVAAIQALPVPQVSVVIPALNEASGIEATLRSIPLDEFRRMGLEAEILVIDNASTDNTGDLATAAGARVVREPVRGYGSAYKRGFAEARGAIICTLDADQTYPADALPGLVSKLATEQLDFISTDRFAYMHNGVMSRRNKIGNAMLSGATRLMFGVPFRDSQSGMWVFRKALLERAHLRSSGMALSEELKIEVAWRLRARCAEVPIKYGYRKGSSKLHVWRDGVGNLLHLALHRLRSRPDQTR